MIEQLIKRWKYKLLIGAAAMFLPMIGIILFIIILIAAIGGNDTAIVRAIEIPGEYLIMAKTQADQDSIDFIRLLTKSAEIAGYDQELYNNETLNSVLAAIDEPVENQELYDIYKKCYGEIKTGPIPRLSRVTEWIYELNPETNKKEWVEIKPEREWTYSNYDDFGADRTYGGERSHLGNDLIADRGTPLVSMTDGVITRLGWDELGGWRVGITDANGTYWYYAHMRDYAPGIHEQQYVQAGTLIGYVGDSGYGPPGTTGQFVNHLHLQIGIAMEDGTDEYVWINPYPIVIYTDPMRIDLTE